MSVTLEQRHLIEGLGFQRVEVCAVLDLCRYLLRSARRSGIVKKTVTIAIEHGGYNLTRWKIECNAFSQKLAQLDDAKESALLSGLEVLEKHLPDIFDDEFKTNINSPEFDEAFSISGFECQKR
jgi:hypothetical protein